MSMELQSIGSPGLWIGFIGFVVAMLALDLGVFHRKSHVIGTKEALIWSSVWVALALLFNLLVWRFYGAERGLEFLTLILGAFKAGAAYLPLDPKHPAERSSQILSLAQVSAVLVARASR